MTPAVEQLVRETMELTGAPQPALMEEDAPVLADDALVDTDRSFYLVGLIGGKDVGKSALVNALAGRSITPSSSYGPGTEGVIAYAHTSQVDALRELLDREVPGQFRIVTHDLPGLRRQVLLDLPDIDSHFASHLQVTRTMLRHMLYPVWIVSVEKYADRQPQQMLQRVAAGNAPNNFVFCLNKIDQLQGFRAQSSGPASKENGPEPEPEAARELRDDFASRLQRTLSLGEPPRVYMISATNPEVVDLPELRQTLIKEKSAQVVRESQELAVRRQDRSLLSWLDGQQLSVRAQRLARLQEDAEELSAQRIGGPLLEEVIPRLLDDPATRGAMTEEILTDRVAHWPVVRLVHTVLSPLFTLIRGATSRNAAPLQTPQGLVDIAMKETGYSASDLVQTTFAQLRQSQPTFGELYGGNRLWEQMPADMAAGELRRILGATVQRQRDTARQRFVRGPGWGAPVRWLLTVGAVLWFPFIQPILHGILAAPGMLSSARALAMLTVEVLGVNYLLSSCGFLILYFVALWLALRWNTQRRVVRLLNSWQATTPSDPSLSLATQTLEWIEHLLAPLRQARERMESLASRAEAMRDTLARAA
jgi:GTPase Era involved in 16S rRNA processing